MRCPHCKDRLVQKAAAGQRLRITGAVYVQDSVLLAKCYWCRKDVTIPLTDLVLKKADAPKVMLRVRAASADT